MKKLVIIALSLCTFIGFAQEGKKEAMMERLTKRKEQSPENRAEIETKQLALKLDLSKNQQSEVREAFFLLVRYSIITSYNIGPQPFAAAEDMTS